MSDSTNRVGKHKFDFARRFFSPSFCWSEFIFPSTLQVSSLIELLLEPLEGEEIFDRIQLGLHEALVNAVRHGNEGDPKKNLRVRRILTPHWWVWQVQDQGPGVPMEARRSSLPAQIDVQRGRGLFLINQCFDDVRWSRRGNRLQLACRRVSLTNDVGNQDL